MEQLINSIKNANIADLKSVLNTENAAMITSTGENLLHLIAQHGKKAAADMLKTILGVRKIDINKQNAKGMTPITMSVLEENLEAFKSFIALPDVKLDISDLQGISILEHALNKKPDFLKAIVKSKKIRTNAIGSNGLPLVCLAVMTKNVFAVEQLIKNGADINAIDKDGNNLIMLSIINQDYPTLKILLSLGVNPDTRNVLGDTPLVMAAAKGSKEIIQKLLKTKKVNVNAQGNNGSTALHWAAMMKNKINQDLLIYWYARKDIKDSADKVYTDYL